MAFTSKTGFKIKGQSSFNSSTRAMNDLDPLVRTGLNALGTISDVLSVPQRTTTMLVTGKYQDPSKALGLKGWGGLAADVVLDPLNFFTGPVKHGIKIGVGKLTGKVFNATKKGTKEFIELAGKKTSSLADDLAKKGFSSLDGGNLWTKTGSNIKTTEQAMDYLDKIRKAGKGIGSSSVIDIAEAGRTSASRYFLDNLDAMKKAGNIDLGGLKIGLPFMEGKTIVSGEYFKTIKDGVANSMSKAFEKAIGSKGVHSIKKFGRNVREAFSTNAPKATLPDTGIWSKQGFDVMKEQTGKFSAKVKTAQEATLQMNVLEKEVMQKLVKESKITKLEIQTIRDSIEIGKALPDNLPKEASDVFNNMLSRKRAIDADRIAMNRPVLKDRVRRELTAGAKTSMEEAGLITKRPASTGAREWKIGTSKDTERVIDRVSQIQFIDDKATRLKKADDLVNQFETTIRGILKQDRMQKELGEWGAKFDVSEAGKRFQLPDGTWTGVKSTFPSEIPQHLRRKKLFNEVTGDFLDMKFPKQGTKRRELFDEVLDQISRKTGDDELKSVIDGIELLKNKKELFEESAEEIGKFIKAVKGESKIANLDNMGLSRIDWKVKVTDLSLGAKTTRGLNHIGVKRIDDLARIKPESLMEMMSKRVEGMKDFNYVTSGKGKEFMNAGFRELEEIADLPPSALAYILGDKITEQQAKGVISKAKGVIRDLNKFDKIEAENVINTAQKTMRKNYKEIGLDRAGAMTDEAKEIVKKVEDGLVYKDRNGKTFLRDPATISDIEKEYAKHGTLFETDLHYLQALDDIDHAKLKVSHDYAQWIKQSGFAVDKKTLIKTHGKIPNGWVQPGLEGLKGKYMPKEFADLVDRAHALTFNEDASNYFLKLHDDMLNWWKTWTLSVIPAYHARNEWDDMARIALIGGMNPLSYMASRYTEIPSIIKGASSGKWDDMSRIGGYSHREIYKLMQDFSVLDAGGVYSDDVTRALADEVASRFKKGAQYLTLSRDNKITKYMFQFGQNRENERRATLFIHYLRQGQSPAEATLNMKKVLFDYSDLTPFERNIMKRSFGFYTFMRKNLELQAKVLLTRPRVHATLFKLGASPEFDEDLFYSPNEIPFKVPTSIGQWFSGSVNKDSQYYVDLNNYLSIAQINDFMPGNIKQTLFSAINPFAQYAIETGTGYDLFRDRYIYPTEIETFFGEPVAMNNPFTRGAKKFFRPLNEFNQLYEGFANVQKETGEYKMPSAQTLKFFTGVRFNEFDIEKRKAYREKKIKREYSELLGLEKKKEKFRQSSQ